MPFKSNQQKKFLFAVHPDIAAKFANHDQSKNKKQMRQQALERRLKGVQRRRA